MENEDSNTVGRVFRHNLFMKRPPPEFELTGSDSSAMLASRTGRDEKVSSSLHILNHPIILPFKY